MEAFADHTFYTDSYKGVSVSADDFTRLALRASYAVDLHTFGRASDVIQKNDDAETIERIRMATCSAAEALARFNGDAAGPNGNAAGPIVSETVGEHSVSYAQPGRAQQEAEMSESEVIAASIRPYLAMTGLMYQGVE